MRSANNDVRKAAKLAGVSREHFYKCIKKYNIRFVSKRKKIKLNKKQLADAYKKLGTCAAIAEHFNYSVRGIHSAMRRYGIKMNSQRKYSVDETFFTKTNEKSFYWAGFIAADGCISRYENGNMCVTLTLALKDINILEKFKHQIKYTGPIYKYTMRQNKKNGRTKIL